LEKHGEEEEMNMRLSPSGRAVNEPSSSEPALEDPEPRSTHDRTTHSSGIDERKGNASSAN